MVMNINAGWTWGSKSQLPACEYNVQYRRYRVLKNFDKNALTLIPCKIVWTITFHAKCCWHLRLKTDKQQSPVHHFIDGRDIAKHGINETRITLHHVGHSLATRKNPVEAKSHLRGSLQRGLEINQDRLDQWQAKQWPTPDCMDTGPRRIARSGKITRAIGKLTEEEKVEQCLTSSELISDCPTF